MSKLVPMTQSGFDAFLERMIPDYASENVRAGHWSEDEALEKSRKQTGSLLPQGLQTKDHHLFTLYDGDTEVGMVWLRAEMDRPIKRGFIFYVEVKEEFRGKGYGKQAMLLIEEKAHDLGIRQMALHVFGNNNVARNLYERMGYQVSSMNMFKDLE